MKRILAFGASNSSKSINHKLATYTAEQLDGVEVDLLDINDFEMPIFGVDREAAEGIPKQAHDFLDRIKKSDGLIISFAEHNGAYTAAFKNLFDWTSRIKGELWSGKPMFTLATSPGARGGMSVLTMAKDRFRFMGGNIVASFSLPSFNDNFDPESGITDADLNVIYQEELEKFSAAL